MEQLTQTLISSAIVILGAIVTFITTNLTKKVKSNNYDLAKKLDEIDSKLIEITKNNLNIEKKLIDFELKTEKRIMSLENKVNLLQIQQKISNTKKETKQNEI